MLEFSETLKELPSALVKAQSIIKNPIRDKKAYNYYYADLDSVLDCIKEPCSKNDLSIIQSPYNQDDVVGVQTMLLHKSGEWVTSRFGSRMVKHDPQSVGSQISYYRRYSLLAIFNMAQEDDDGASVSRPTQKANTATTTKRDNTVRASEKQKNLLLNLMGKADYEEHMEFIESEMTSQQASAKIKILMDAKK